MTTQRMLELCLLNQLNDYIRNLTEEDYVVFSECYDINKLEKRSRELTDDFLKEYVIDKSVTAK